MNLRSNDIPNFMAEMMPTIEDQKRAPRLIVALSVALSEGASHYLADAENVSHTGLCLRPRKMFPVGTQLHLVFGGPPELPGVSVEAIVRWSLAGKGVGVEFTSISADDHQALKRFVNSQSPWEDV